MAPASASASSQPTVVDEYLDNIRQLLEADEFKFRLMVDRQIRGRLMPRLSGNRQRLEGSLWKLLVFCLDGHQASAPELDDEAFTRAEICATRESGLSSEEPAAFPRAAHTVLEAMQTIREIGIYPRPLI